MSHVSPRVLGHLATHHGLITPQQARDLGMSTPYIRSMLRDRLWLVLHRGVYVDADLWHTLDPWRAQPLLRARAAVMVMKRGFVLSHDSAAHALGLDVLVVPGVRPFVHVTRPGDTNAWTRNGVKHHLARFSAKDVVEIDGLLVLNQARTVVDMAREHGSSGGLVVADSALRQGSIVKNDLWNVVDGMTCWPYVTTVRFVIEIAHPGAQTPVESLGRELGIEVGLGEPDPQWPLQRSDGHVAWCDIRFGRHVVEVHGKVKVLPPELGGVARQPAAEVVWEIRKRERLVTAEGLGVTNLYYADFFGEARKAAGARLRAEADQTIARFGAVLPDHLARSAREIRASRDGPDTPQGVGAGL